MIRYFEFINDISSKFWEIENDTKSNPKRVTVRFGKVGTPGRTSSIIYHGDTSLGNELVIKKVEEKTKKGYIEKKSHTKKITKKITKKTTKKQMFKKTKSKNDNINIVSKDIINNLSKKINKPNLEKWKKETTRLSKLYSKTLQKNGNKAEDIAELSDSMKDNILQKRQKQFEILDIKVKADIYKKIANSNLLMKYWYSENFGTSLDLWQGPKGTKKEAKKIIIKVINDELKTIKKTIKKQPVKNLVVKTATKKQPVKKLVYKKTKSLWDITKKGIMLAHTFKDHKTGKIKNPPKGTPKAPNGWWMSEKFDGYRALWDGQNFVSRGGNIFEAPDYFKKWMPTNIVLDGELFLGRRCFEKCGIFRRKVPDDKEWKKLNVNYNIFDAPAHKGLFEARMDFIKTTIKTLCAKKGQLGKCPLNLVKQTKIKSEADLNKYFKKLTTKGAEGVMIRAPKSPYESKRSSYLLKVKQQFDAECKIVGYNEGSGKYKGKLGAFKCQLVKNKSIEFNISGMDDSIRTNYKKTHPIGTIVTFTYMELSSKGVPRHPNYLRIRKME